VGEVCGPFVALGAQLDELSGFGAAFGAGLLQRRQWLRSGFRCEGGEFGVCHR
jgi:hypothetical protein